MSHPLMRNINGEPFAILEDKKPQPAQVTPMGKIAGKWPGDETEEQVAEGLATLQPKPTGTEAEVCRLITLRQLKGIYKYGKTVRGNPLELREWLQHALEECLDQAIYLQRAIEELDK